MRRLSIAAAVAVAIVAALLVLVPSLRRERASAAAESHPPAKKIAVLLVSHGSRSATWRAALTDLGERVRGPILAEGKVTTVTSAFMEYTEPSIATRLTELDGAGVTDVIVVPIFLTVSPHTFDDIPTLIGQKDDPESIAHLKVEKIERYRPKARTHLTPPLDFTDLLRKNVARRVAALSSHPAEEGLVLIAYGDETYEKQWVDLLTDVAATVRKEDGIDTWSYGWCGHLVEYDPKKTTDAISVVLAQKPKALVIPVLVAFDENFQIKIIGGGIAKVPDEKTRVVYKPDSILPDQDVEQWVIAAAGERARAIAE